MSQPLQLGQIEERKPIVLKNVWPKKVIAMRIGGLLLELWEPQKRNAEPYATLVKEEDDRHGKAANKKSHASAEQLQMTLNPMQACMVVGAIQEWQSLWATDFKRSNLPCLCVQLDTLTMKLYSRTRRRVPHAEIVLTNDKIVEATVSLTCTETLLLAGALRTIVPDDENDCRQRDVEA